MRFLVKLLRALARLFAPTGAGVLPPAPPAAGRGVLFTPIVVEPALIARVTPCGYPGCACSPDLVASTARCGDERPAPVVGEQGSLAYQSTNLQPSETTAFDEPTPVGLVRGTT